MDIDTAQREMRTVYLGGFAGQLVSGLLWLISAALATWIAPRYGIIFLLAGGFFIFPLTQLALALMGRRATLSPENGLRQLGMFVAFTLPLNLPLVGGTALYRLEWFYPAFMIVLGSHYLPFIFLYGMWQFGILAAALVGAGLAIALYLPNTPFSLGGWLTALLLMTFAFVGRAIVLKEDARTQTEMAL